jgi:hypothetical protein
MDKISLLETFGRASWTDTTFVEPVAVGVQAIFDMFFINRKIQIAGQLSGPLPSVNF